MEKNDCHDREMSFSEVSESGTRTKFVGFGRRVDSVNEAKEKSRDRAMTESAGQSKWSVKFLLAIVLDKKSVVDDDPADSTRSGDVLKMEFGRDLEFRSRKKLVPLSMRTVVTQMFLAVTRPPRPRPRPALSTPRSSNERFTEPSPACLRKGASRDSRLTRPLEKQESTDI